MVFKYILVILLACDALCLERGDPCHFNSTSGVCKSIDDCPFARKLLYDDERKPPMCKWEGDLRIVCCPTVNLFHRTGIFREYFFHSNDGIKRTNEMSCRYSGVQPLLCCPKVREVEVPPEPTGCPRLSRPRLNVNKQHFAWSKCLDYQRYFNKCVSTAIDPNVYTRVDTCGRDTFRIAGGSEANPKEFPHMAVLGCRNVVPTETSDVVWIGGGSLISEKFILTAAHVLVSPTHGVIKFALLGTLNKTDTKSGLLYNIVRRIPYPNYQSSSLNYDIALVELERRVFFSEFIRPACLPVPGREIESDRIIAGWGETGQRTTSEILLTADLQEVNLCSNKFEGKSFAWNERAMICAVGKKESSKQHYSDSCKGDSGGPLMAFMKNIKCSYSIEGVVSKGPRDCGQGSPGVYSRVTHYLPWILKIVWPQQYS